MYNENVKEGCLKVIIISHGMEASFIRCHNIYISTLPRTRETAKMLFPDTQYRECALLNEVPLRAWIDTKTRCRSNYPWLLYAYAAKSV
ncbi:hypothetical protein SAMN02910358_01543 [Lachnospiraceae bacterium XBB1006]|nr:hypothetical protein SAMN02910358_01543 [Lachnospiraceae bacterium XBB1006]